MKVDREELVEAVNRLNMTFFDHPYVEHPCVPLPLKIINMMGGIISQLPVVETMIDCGEHIGDINLVCEAIRNLTKYQTIEGEVV